MTDFNESNTIEQMILDAVAQHDDKLHPARWDYVLPPRSQVNPVRLRSRGRKSCLNMNYAEYNPRNGL